MKKINIELTPRQAAVLYEKVASEYMSGDICLTDPASLQWNYECIDLLLTLIKCLKIEHAWYNKSTDELHQMILGEVT